MTISSVHLIHEREKIDRRSPQFCFPTKMRILFFDTETNGLPKRPAISAADYPSIVQLAWQLWDSNKTTQTLISKHSHIIKPPLLTVWNLESQQFHTITHQRAIDEGEHCSDIFHLLRDDLLMTDMIVAHNLSFDLQVLNAEAERRGLPPLLWPSRSLCTMKASKDFCKLPSTSSYHTDPYKFPKLSELYSLLFETSAGITFHNAADDVEATQKCFHELARRRVLRFEDRLFLVCFGPFEDKA